MGAWWSALSGLEQILYCIAIPSTLVLLLQVIMEVCGFDFGGDDLDVDIGDATDWEVSENVDLSGDTVMSDVSAMRFFTFQGIVAFFAIFGWSSILALKGGSDNVIAIFIGTVFGLLAMYVVAKVLQLVSKLTQSGTLDIKNALGENGRVYLTIPPRGEGYGKVNVTVQGNLQEFEALNNSEEPIKTGESIRVVDVEGSFLVVEKE